MAHVTLRMPREYRDGGVLIAFTVFAAEIVFEGTALAGAKQPQVVPASPACMRTQDGRIGGGDDSEIDVLCDVFGDAVVAVDPKRTHRAGGGLPLTVHEMVYH